MFWLVWGASSTVPLSIRSRHFELEALTIITCMPRRMHMERALHIQVVTL